MYVPVCVREITCMCTFAVIYLGLYRSLRVQIVPVSLRVAIHYAQLAGFVE